MTTSVPLEIFVTGYNSPEGPAFDRDGNLFFVNWLTHSIVKLTPDGVASEFYNTGGIPAGLAFHPDGSLYVADEGEHIHGVLRITPDGDATILVNSFEGNPLNGANDLVFDKNGVLYFSDPWGTSADNPTGGFYRLFPNGTLEQIDTGLAFPNGLALTGDGSSVILAETYRDRLLRYAIRDDGTVGPREHWADFPTPSGPDGMAFAANGNLYVAHFNGGSVEIFDPSGTHVGAISIPGANVTNIAFAPDGETAIVTEVSTASLYRVHVGVAGLALYGGRM